MRRPPKPAPRLPDLGSASGKLSRNEGRRAPGEAGMVQVATKIIDEAPSAIDRGHLARMTFNDRSLEREVLQLFDRQATLLIGRMRAGDAAMVGSLAHTLKGSATGIGAGPVARAAG